MQILMCLQTLFYMYVWGNRNLYDLGPQKEKICLKIKNFGRFFFCCCNFSAFLGFLEIPTLSIYLFCTYVLILQFQRVTWAAKLGTLIKKWSILGDNHS